MPVFDISCQDSGHFVIESLTLRRASNPICLLNSQSSVHSLSTEIFIAIVQTEAENALLHFIKTGMDLFRYTV